jgi:hypothetical protein
MEPADVDDGVELRIVDILVVGVGLQDLPGIDLCEIEPDRFRLHFDRRVADAGCLERGDLLK